MFMWPKDYSIRHIYGWERYEMQKILTLLRLRTMIFQIYESHTESLRVAELVGLS